MAGIYLIMALVVASILIGMWLSVIFSFDYWKNESGPAKYIGCFSNLGLFLLLIYLLYYGFNFLERIV